MRLVGDEDARRASTTSGDERPVDGSATVASASGAASTSRRTHRTPPRVGKRRPCLRRRAARRARSGGAEPHSPFSRAEARASRSAAAERAHHSSRRWSTRVRRRRRAARPAAARARARRARGRGPGRGRASTRRRAVELAVGERQILDVADARVDPALARELDHALRDCRRATTVAAELALDPLGELAAARSRPRARGAARPRRPPRTRPRARSGPSRRSRRATRRAARPASSRTRADDAPGRSAPHGSRIGVPGMPRPAPCRRARR